MNSTAISIVIGTYNRKRMLIHCIKSVRNNGITVPYEIIVVDGGSQDGTAAWLADQKDISTNIQPNRIKLDGRMTMKKSWGHFMNLGFKASTGKYLCMLSDDLFVHSSSIMSAYNLLENDKENLFGACAFPFRDCFINDTYFVYKAFDHKVLVNHGMYRRDLLETLGWIDEENYRFYLADTDLSLKIWRRGYRIAVSSDSCVEHFRYDSDPKRSGNLALSKQSKDYARFIQLWGLGNEGVPKITKEYFPRISRELRVWYLPGGWLFKFLFAKIWLKGLIKRNDLLYRRIKAVKRAFFSDRRAGNEYRR